MRPMSTERFAVAMTPLPTAARVMRHRRALRMRTISAVVSLAILLALLYFFNPGWSTGVVVWLCVVWGATTAIWFVISFVGLHRAKRDLAAISQGEALYIDGTGIEFVHPQPVRATWAEITALKISGSSFGAGPALVMEAGGQRVAQVPMSFLDTLPSAIDSAVVARSLGRVRLDVTDMDRMI